MEFIPAPGVAQFNLIYQTNGGTAQNVFHVHQDSGAAWTETQLHTMCVLMGAWEQDTARAQRSNQVHNIEILARDLTVQNGAESSVDGEGLGLIASAAAPDSVTIAIKKNTGLVGRSFRGRTFWIGIPFTKVNGDVIDGTYVTAVVAALQALKDAVNATTGFHLCLLRSQNNGVKLNPRQEAPISSFLATDLNVDSQRRRLLGRGR